LVVVEGGAEVDAGDGFGFGRVIELWLFEKRHFEGRDGRGR
jgi:hypothetical protein